ncbi:putative Aldo-keto reductase yakc [Glarea lozoyensis 74030]|uniref:Putative Aldo-keto reductase yakc n=1 Tax=Glarea lozoyensis (strain ATCC 74030 / MF5533) TaxID=1104152 RepID=H0EP14_GLAL7|nr:putative Aldo-keto reductase yakc [Glarea lozoyensis 74030]
MPATLQTRKLGKNGPEIPAIGFGLMGMSGFYGPLDSDEERFKILDRAIELGATNCKWFKRTGKRNEVFLATKFGNKMDEKGNFTVSSTGPYVREAWEKSSKRLGVDCFDLYYMHRTDGVTPIEETVEAMVKLKNEGKIKYLGLSEVSSATLRRACKIHHIAAVQMEYSPFSIDIEHESTSLLKTCRELGVAVVAYSPLGRGMITNAYRSPADFDASDFRRYLPRFSEENFPKNIKLVDGIVELAKKKGCTPSQLTLAWLLKQGNDIIPIPGTKKVKYLEENLGAAKVEISDEEEKQVRKLVEDAEVVGDRYSEGSGGCLFGDTPERK